MDCDDRLAGESTKHAGAVDTASARGKVAGESARNVIHTSSCIMDPLTDDTLLPRGVARED